ncbi:MAG: biopolymer transporter ExbD [Methylococcaceae bacterium]|jgi:biopolymer transport protein ExbD
MAFGSFGHNNNSQPVSEINMIPLIDVMLVLLIIFMITAPLMTQAVKIDLPNANSQPQQTESEAIDLSIDGSGQLFWQQGQLSRAEYNEKLHNMAQLSTMPELHIRADQAAPYRFIAEVLADAAKAGVNKIGFVTDPEPAHHP